MDIVAKKYDNFKTFIRNIIPKDNEFGITLGQTSFDYFIKTIKEKSIKGLNKEECLKEIFDEAKLNQNDYKKEDIDKLILYLEYFNEISKHIL
jgi:predicted DNA-binding protein (UPF0278 family)